HGRESMVWKDLSPSAINLLLRASASWARELTPVQVKRLNDLALGEDFLEAMQLLGLSSIDFGTPPGLVSTVPAVSSDIAGMLPPRTVLADRIREFTMVLEPLIENRNRVHEPISFTANCPGATVSFEARERIAAA